MSEAVMTAEQEAAVKHRGRSLLVSAAAGSGKTKVLVERLLDMVENGDDIDEFLVITYTRAAASELRGRIYDEILERLADNPDNRRLRRQSILCRAASISTIHSYCTELLREHAHLAELAPDFRVMDDSESGLLKTAVLENVLNAAYEEIETSGSFKALIDAVATGRDDKRLAEMIIDAHKKLQSNPRPRQWLESRIEEFSEILANEEHTVWDVSETPWGKYLIEKAKYRAGYWRDELVRLREEMRAYLDFDNAYGPCIDESIASCDAFLAGLDAGWDEAIRNCDIVFPRPKPIGGYDDFKDVRNKCKAELAACTALLQGGSEEHFADMQAVSPAMIALMRLILEFDDAYLAEKRSRGTVDFSDLEHMVLSLLVDVETGEKTELAVAASTRFKEIMIDEYQDVNAVQEEIFNALSRDGGNVFMVGDVKQSIYRFRLADPTIFLEKYRRAGDGGSGGVGGIGGGGSAGGVGRTSDVSSAGVVGVGGGAGGAGAGGGVGVSAGGGGDAVDTAPPSLILLSKNFRSQPGILHFVNFIFGSIMSPSFGEMEYSEREMLVPGREGDAEETGAEETGAEETGAEETGDAVETGGAEKNGNIEETDGFWPGVEFVAIDMSTIEKDEEEENPRKTQIEARYIAERIAEMVDNGTEIPDGQGGTRRVDYDDIVILLRSVRGKAWQYADMLAEHGIPADIPGTEGFFESVEVNAALSLLAVIDNPMQDIPLAAALRGPVYGFSADELAEIRARSKNTNFYIALKQAAASNEKCASFLADIEAMRLIAPDMPAARFIWHLYNKTELLGRVGAMRGGVKRRENLLNLVEYARAFEENGYRGLFGFLVYMNNLREKGEEPSREESLKIGNSVRIMSIHKSKGLEFPIVFIADGAKRFNFTDIHEPLVMHPIFGLGIKRIDRQRRIAYPTIARMAIQGKLAEEMLAEELRVLYVAMTRAREKLIITATFKDAGREIEKTSKLVRGEGPASVGTGEPGFAPVPAQVLEGMRSPADWIVAALLQGGKSVKVVSGEGGDGGMVAVPGGSGMTAGAESNRAAEAESGGNESVTESGESKVEPSIRAMEAEALSVKMLRERFAYKYPYEKAPELPSKLTVTELKGRIYDAYDAGDAQIVEYSKQSGDDGKRPAYRRPRFILEKAGLTAAERGTALHQAMQCIDYAKCGNESGVESEIARMRDEGILSEEQAAAIDRPKVVRFFESDIGKRVLRSQSMKREFKFSLLHPAERYYAGGGDDKILLQGIIDCFFEEDGMLVVIDFKTDRVLPGKLMEKAADYAPQIASYSSALESITGKNVTERVLYFFDADAAVCL